MKRLLRVLALPALLAAIDYSPISGPTTISAAIAYVAVIPAEPTEWDSITIHVEGGLPNSCWHFVGSHCPSLQSNMIEIDSFTTVSGEVCLPVYFPYSFNCSVGTLPEGQYSVIVREWDPFAPPGFPPRDESEMDFVVSTRVAGVMTSWSRIKALYE